MRRVTAWELTYGMEDSSTTTCLEYGLYIPPCRTLQ